MNSIFNNMTNSFIALISVYLLVCLCDMMITVPIISPLHSIIIVDKKTNKTREITDYKTEPIIITHQESFIVVFDIERLRSGNVRLERKIQEMDDGSVYSISISNKSVFPEKIRLKTAIDVPDYIKTGCKTLYTDSFYEYTYNVLTILNPIKVRIPSFDFCIKN